MMERKTAIGWQSFEAMRNLNIFYADKTLNLDMLNCFFSNKYANRSDLFEGLSIWEDERFRKIQGTYPVIFMSFASVKSGDTDKIKAAVKQIISNIYDSFQNIMQSEVFSDKDREYYACVSNEMAYSAINQLCIYLERYYGKKVIVLLDEYDTPMQEAWLAGNWDVAVEFFRCLFNSTFKTNANLERGIVTGILTLSGAKFAEQTSNGSALAETMESIFSDLNNPEVITTTSSKYAVHFGFTEQEVFEALDEMGLENEKDGVKQWYDGFTFGNVKDIYNPWSIMSFINNNGVYDTYWADTSGNGLISSLIQKGTVNIKQTMEQLLKGESFETVIDEQIVFNQLDSNPEAIWSLMVATGYLKVEKIEYVGRLLKKVYTLRITNTEVESMFSKMIEAWFSSSEGVYNDFVKALLMDDVELMNEFMNRIALVSFSSFDTSKGTASIDAPERF